MDGSSRALVFLIGYRGTGKSTLAKLLAKRLGWRWLDADAVLEKRHGKTIQAIFAEEGEPSFRAKEAALLLEFSALRQHVIATGGGVVLRPENRACLKTGVCIWLSADLDTIEHRLQNDATTAARRPALTVGGRAEIEQLLREREPLYRECADIAVDTVDRAIEDIADEVYEGLLELDDAEE